MGFISEFTYSQKVNSSKGVEVMIKVGKHGCVPKRVIVKVG